MAACSIHTENFGQSPGATSLVDFVLQLTLPELTEKRVTLLLVLNRLEKALGASPLHDPTWDMLRADAAYVKHSIELLERAMLYAPHSMEAQRAVVLTTMERAHG